jgi:hypothetical protein
MISNQTIKFENQIEVCLRSSRNYQQILIPLSLIHSKESQESKDCVVTWSIEAIKNSRKRFLEIIDIITIDC